MYMTNDVKADYINWLEQKGYSKALISSNINLMQKILDNNFPSQISNWNEIQECLLPLLVKYSEFANKGYYLDNITVWYALKYFNDISNIVYSNSLLQANEDVSVYIHDGKNDYFVCITNLKYLYDNVLTICTYLYETNNKFENKYNSSIDPIKLILLISELNENSEIEDVKKLAIRIVYNLKNIKREKSALEKYCNFCTTVSSIPDCTKDKNIRKTKNDNPGSIIKSNYKESQKLTGSTCLQVELKNKEFIYWHNNMDDNDDSEKDFCLLKEDLIEILNMDRKTIKKYFINYNTKIDKILVDPKKVAKHWHLKCVSTVLRYYFSLSSINSFLEKGFRKLDEQHKAVNYDCEGYSYWITRIEATRRLNISHNAFHSLINSEKCTRLVYLPDHIRYYAPDIEYLKTTSLLKRALRRKNKYIINK